MPVILLEFTDNHVATWLVSYFMKKPALSSLHARVSPMKICLTELHDERLSSYVKVVNFLLITFATDDIIARAIKE